MILKIDKDIFVYFDKNVLIKWNAKMARENSRNILGTNNHNQRK